MKKLLSLLALIISFAAHSQTLYQPPNISAADSLQVAVNINNAPRKVYAIDLSKYRAALAVHDTATALRILIATNAASTVTNATAVGTLSSLTTTAKSNLVSAINEVNAKPSGSATDTSSLSNRINANGTAIAGKQASLGWLSIDSYGAPTDSTTDASTAIRAALAALPATGGTIILPARYIRWNDSIVCNKPVTFLGSGIGSTIILTSSGTINLIVLNSPFSTVDGMSFFNRSSTPTAGSAIKTGSTGTFGSYACNFQNLYVEGFYDNFNFQSSNDLFYDNVRNTKWVHYGVLLRNNPCVDCGDQSFSNSWFNNGGGRSGLAAIRYESGGGLKVNNVKFNWYEGTTRNSYALDVNLDNTVDMLVANCSFENYSVGAIRIVRGAGYFNSVVIHGNQFSPFTTGTTDIAISGGVTNVMIGDNLFAGGDNGINVNGGDHVTVGYNMYNNTVASKTFTSVTNLVDATAALLDISVLTLYDDFNRADNTTSIGSLVKPATAWNVSTGTWGIIGSQGYLASEISTGSLTTNRIYKDAGKADYSYSMDVSVASASSSAEIDLLFRYSDSVNTFLVATNGRSSVSLFKQVANAYSQIGSTYNFTAVSAGTIFNLKVVTSGSSITVYKDGTSVITGTDTFNQTATKIGVNVFSGTGYGGGARFDNLKLQ